METIKKQDGFASQKLFVIPQTLLEELPKYALLQSLYMTDIGYFPHALFHYRERPEGSNSHIVIYCAGGSGWFSVEGERRMNVRQGTVFVIPAHTPHSYAANEDDPWSIYWLHIKGSHALAFLGDTAAVQTLSVSPDKSMRLEQLFHECFDVLEKGYSLNNLIHVSQVLGHLLSCMFIYQGQSSLPSDSSSFPIDRIIQIMIDRLESTLSLQSLADQVNLSKPHLIYLFKKHTGYPPIDYYIRLKIQSACKYLDLTDYTMKEICRKLGFADPYYFSRVFSKIMGISPTQYRKHKKG